jgi:hypothetical protein
MTWLARTPTALVQACATMLTRLDAEEASQAANRVAMGSGTMSAESQRETARAWARASHAEPVRERATAARLRQTGIGMRRVARKAVTHD